MTPSQLEAQRRVLTAMQKVEHAQVLLDQACSDIYSVTPMSAAGDALGKVSDKVKAQRYELRDWSLSKIDLDSSAKRTFDAKPAQNAESA